MLGNKFRFIAYICSYISNTTIKFDDDLEFKAVMERAKTGDVTVKMMITNTFVVISVGIKAKKMIFTKSIKERSQVTFLVDRCLNSC